MTTVVKQLKTQECESCGATMTQITKGSLYTHYGCGVCRNVQRKHNGDGIMAVMVADIAAEDLKQKISDLLGVECEVYVRITTLKEEQFITAIQ